jgi:hypothetical protein
LVVAVDAAMVRDGAGVLDLGAAMVGVEESVAVLQATPMRKASAANHGTGARLSFAVSGADVERVQLIE